MPDNTPLSQPTQTTANKKKLKKCNECNEGIALYENLQLCIICHKIKVVYKLKQSGNKIIDDFIRYTQITPNTRMEFVPYKQFKNVEFIAEGGFSKIYKAIWIDGPPTTRWRKKGQRSYKRNYPVVLKKLNNSKNITSKELNEVCTIIIDYSILI